MLKAKGNLQVRLFSPLYTHLASSFSPFISPDSSKHNSKRLQYGSQLGQDVHHALGACVGEPLGVDDGEEGGFGKERGPAVTVVSAMPFVSYASRIGGTPAFMREAFGMAPNEFPLAVVADR